MSITAEQIGQIRAWAAEGSDLNSIQKKLAEIGCNIRFMDLRFLLLDHGIEIAEPKPAQEESPEAVEAANDTAGTAGTAVGKAPKKMPEGKSVEVYCDDLQIPGTIISGKAIFRSGARGSWQFDLQGNFSWSSMSANPEETEFREFQIELNNMLRKMA